MAYVTQDKTYGGLEVHLIKTSTGVVIDYQSAAVSEESYYLSALTACFASAWEKGGGETLVDPGVSRLDGDVYAQIDALNDAVQATLTLTNRLSKILKSHIRAPELWVVRYKSAGKERAVACVVLDDNTALIVSRPIVIDDRVGSIARDVASIVGVRWCGINAFYSLASDELKANRFIDHDPGTDIATLNVDRFRRVTQETHNEYGKYVKMCLDFTRAAELLAEHNEKWAVKNV